VRGFSPIAPSVAKVRLPSEMDALEHATEPMIMDFCLLIRVRPGDVFQASVITVDCARAWRKTYPSKEDCASELCEIGLVTILSQHDLMNSDFDMNDRTLLFMTAVQAEFLEEAGFVETTQKRLN
jgi:hypothetical protein